MSNVTSDAVKLFMEKNKGGESVPGQAINQLKNTMEYDPNAGDAQTASGAKAQREAPKLPGSWWDHGGTTQFNPLPSDPRVEAILGVKKYKAAISKESPEAQQLKIATLEQQVAMLTTLVGAKVQEPAELEPVKLENEIPDYENMEYSDLLTTAKSMYPDLKGRMKREILIQRIKEG